MRYFGQITGLDTDGHTTSWLVALDDDGMPSGDGTLLPAETMPEVVPVWALTLPIGTADAGDGPLEEVAMRTLHAMRQGMARFKRTQTSQ